MSVAGAEGRPLDDVQAADLFQPLTRFDFLALAVSGGGDSMALLHLFDRWRRSCAEAPAAVVFTVDHGLRPEAAEEAAMVAFASARLGLSHQTLYWRGPKPDHGVQEAARAARYALMAQALDEAAPADARKTGLVLAHTRDDQAETFLDRLARGSGVYGLSAMARESRRAETTLLRPLLDVSRARLRASLAAFGVPWVDDPSNDDMKYRRVRMRRLLPVLEAEGLGAERLAATAHSMARAAGALDGWVDRVMEVEVIRHPAGPCRFEVALLDHLPEEIALRLLARLLRDTAGSVHVPRLVRLEAVLAGLRSSGASSLRRTLGGCVIELRDGAVVIHRESGREGLSALQLAPGETGTWDGRFAVTLSADAAGPVCVQALGEGGLKRIGLEPPKGWPRGAFATAPAALCNPDGANPMQGKAQGGQEVDPKTPQDPACGEESPLRAGELLVLPGFSLEPVAGWHGGITVRQLVAGGAV